MAVADLSAYGLKLATGVERPPERYTAPAPLVHAPHDGSFPSGHTSTSFAAAALLAAVAPRLAPAFFLLALAIGFSRVYVGVHWPIDVLGGVALGLAVGYAVRALLRRGEDRLRSGRPPRSG